MGDLSLDDLQTYMLRIKRHISAIRADPRLSRSVTPQFDLAAVEAIADRVIERSTST